MPSMGMAQYSRAAGLTSPATPIRAAVVAAIEYAGALPATAMTIESDPPSAPRRSPWSLVLMYLLLQGGATSSGPGGSVEGTVRTGRPADRWPGGRGPRPPGR